MVAIFDKLRIGGPRTSLATVNLIALCVLATLIPGSLYANLGPAGSPLEASVTPEGRGHMVSVFNPPRTITLKAAKGDTLLRILGRQGISPVDRLAITHAFTGLFGPNHIKAEDQIQLAFEPTGVRRVRSLRFKRGTVEDVTVNIDNGRPHSRTVPIRVVRHVSGTIGKSLQTALKTAEVPAPLIKETVTALKYVTSPSSPTKHARFSVLYDESVQKGRMTAPKLRYVALDDGHRVHRVYRYQTKNGVPDFVHANGKGIALLELRQPIAKIRVTSPYGWRIHPVFGDMRFHKGVDFGAPQGTPVFAAADGIIADIGFRGNYGEYIRIRHNKKVETVYAHLSRFAHGLQTGSAVKAGQMIGAVGQTGIATGPHLYYEVVIGGERIDPLKAPPAVPIKLTGADLGGFKRYLQQVAKNDD